MRILVAGPPKTGNVWIEHVLASIYGLTILEPGSAARNYGPFRASVEQGWFTEDSIFHQHFFPSDELFDIVGSVHAFVVTPIRNPYDLFVSLYHYAQSFSEAFVAAGNPASIVIGKPIDHPDVLRYMEEGFRIVLDLGLAWLKSGRSLVVRYERLHTSPLEEVRSLTRAIQPVQDESIVGALKSSVPDVMRRKSPAMERHIRSATVGGWRSHLNAKHLELMRNAHGPTIAALGYTVESDSGIGDSFSA